jgi:hypothetical protein
MIKKERMFYVKNIKQKIFIMLLIGLSFLAVPRTSYAATSLVELKPGKTYTSYDVTKDGKKDKIKIVQGASYASDGYTSVKVYINGKKKITAEGCKNCIIYLFKNGSKSVLLYQSYFGDGSSCFYGYKYKNGKFKETELGTSLFLSEVKKSKTYLKIYSEPKGTWWFSSFKNFSSMPFKVVDTYKISGGNLVKVNTYPGISGTKTYYAKYSFKTGKTIKTIAKKNGPSVKAGQKITLKNYYQTSDGTYFKISVNGKTGWFEDSEKIQFRR